MQTKLISLTFPRWSNAQHSAIDCIITTSQFADEPLPFTASQDDIEPHGRAIFQEITEGKYGPIAEYIEPSNAHEQNQPTVTGAQTL